MCRLLGVVSSEPTDFRLSLREAPRSLALLSREHPHGWGIAVWGDGDGWSVKKEPACALDDDRFHDVAHACRGRLLLAHVRNRTVGQTTVENTHPFRRGSWVFAHNGTIAETDRLRRGASPARLAEITGETDSELLFAYLLTRLDAAHAFDVAASATTDATLMAAMRDLLDGPIGACNFLLSNGDTLYGHRSGRTLFLLERVPGDPVVEQRRSKETGATIETPWSPRRRAVLIASESITDEPWRELDEGALVRIDRLPQPSWRVL